MSTASQGLEKAKSIQRPERGTATKGGGGSPRPPGTRPCHSKLVYCAQSPRKDNAGMPRAVALKEKHVCLHGAPRLSECLYPNLADVLPNPNPHPNL